MLSSYCRHCIFCIYNCYVFIEKCVLLNYYAHEKNPHQMKPSQPNGWLLTESMSNVFWALWVQWLKPITVNLPRELGFLAFSCQAHTSVQLIQQFTLSLDLGLAWLIAVDCLHSIVARLPGRCQAIAASHIMLMDTCLACSQLFVTRWVCVCVCVCVCVWLFKDIFQEDCNSRVSTACRDRGSKKTKYCFKKSTCHFPFNICYIIVVLSKGFWGLGVTSHR